MNSKLFRILDACTDLTILAILVSSSCADSDVEANLLTNSGHGECGCVYVINLETGECQRDFVKWSNSTMTNAHLYIEQNWDNLSSGNTIDIQSL